jgi:hypothetical protein
VSRVHAHLSTKLLLRIGGLPVCRLDNGVGKLRVELAFAAQQGPEADKVKEGPKLAQIILDGGACCRKSSVCV